MADTGKHFPVSCLDLKGYPATTPPSNSSSLATSLTGAKYYYSGLPSAPVLVARTGTTPWEAPIGSEGLKELRAVGKHVLEEVWEDNLAFKLHALLDLMDVKWTSTDVVRIGKTGSSSAPVILWIGAMPGSGREGVVAAFKCRELLTEYSIADVEVKIRESIVTRSLAASPIFSRPPLHLTQPLMSAGLFLPR
jgi:hypothetical protein